MNNITKKTQTILFASLLTAMILPFSGMNNAYAETTTSNISIEELDSDVKKLLEKSKSSTSKSEQQAIKKQLNELGIATKKQINDNPEKWIQIAIKTQGKKSSFDNTESPTLASCGPNCPGKAAVWPGVFYECGKSYMCSGMTQSWILIPEGDDHTTNFYNNAEPGDRQGWYFITGPNNSSKVVWEDIYAVIPIGFDEDHNYNEDVTPAKYKLLELVHNNPAASQVSMYFHISYIN